MQTNEKVQKLIDYIMTKDYGDTILHQEISSIIGVPYKSQSYRSIVNVVKKYLEQTGHMIECKRSIGYFVVYPDDYSDIAVKEVVSAGKKINRGARIVNNAPVNKMSSIGLENHNRIVDKMQILQASMAGAKVELHMLNKKREHPLQLSK